MATPIFPLLLCLHFSNSLPFLQRKADTGSTNAKLDHIQQNIVTLEQNDGVPECINDIEPKFRLLTRNSGDIRRLSHLVILIHGFNSWPEVWADDLAKLILEGDTERKALGVLVVDWEKGARWENLFTVWTDYSRSVANTRCLAHLTSLLIQQLPPPTPSLHCIGHSLGAHVCGFLSNKLEKSWGRKIERITGLDPAGIDWTTRRVGLMKVEPMPVLPHVDSRLDASDADLVDVIHTDGNFAGTMEPSGDVDFYVGRTEESLGSSQKDCGCTDNCDHARSFKLFAESVNQPTGGVGRMMECTGIQNFSLHECQDIEGSVPKQVFGYFYKGEMKGLVGVLIQSDAVEMPCMSENEEWEEVKDFEWEQNKDDWEEWGSDEDWGDLDYEGDAVMGGGEQHFEEEEKSSGKMIKQAVVANFDFDTFSLLESFTTDEHEPGPATALPESMAWNGKSSGTSCGPVCISIISAVASFLFVSVLICLYACSRTSYLRLHSSKQSL